MRTEDVAGPARAERLTFRDDPGASRSTWIAAALVLLVASWFASGMLSEPEAPDLPPPHVAGPQVQVAVRTSTARTITEVLAVEGQTIPERETAVLAETSGKIIALPVKKGATLAAGDVIARFDATGPEADLRRAEAEAERATREYENAETLLERGVSTLDRVSDMRAALAAATAGLADARDAFADTVIRAPFEGRLEDLAINTGEYVTAGAPVARIVDNSPLTVRARVAQQAVAAVQAGLPARVGFITGETRTGIVRFVSTNADTETRTFLMEIEVANDDGALPAGISAEVLIETGETQAHFVSPALLVLDERGALGLKTVDGENRVGFYEVEVVKAETNGVWITGLPDQVQIISIGQGFVRSGETVVPSQDDRALPVAEGALQ